MAADHYSTTTYGETSPRAIRREPSQARAIACSSLRIHSIDIYQLSRRVGGPSAAPADPPPRQAAHASRLARAYPRPAAPAVGRSRSSRARPPGAPPARHPSPPADCSPGGVRPITGEGWSSTTASMVPWVRSAIENSSPTVNRRSTTPISASVEIVARSPTGRKRRNSRMIASEQPAGRASSRRPGVRASWPNLAVSRSCRASGRGLDLKSPVVAHAPGEEMPCRLMARYIIRGSQAH